jgi:hypothetical protein
MGINLADLIHMSPCLYHVTYEDSLNRIRRLRCLESAAILMQAGGQLEWLRRRRDAMVRFFVDGDLVVLTDQRPINEKNIAFQDGWTLGDLIESINRRVFFWRGGREGLLKSNQGHFGRYEGEGHRLAFLRLCFEETRQLNTDRGPDLCMHNSGAARKYDGKPIPRGPKTFVQPEDAEFNKGEIQEVVFRAFADLPATTEVCSGSWKGPWQPLFQDG